MLEPAEDYSQLKVGNYWVYQRYNIDLETGEKLEINETDSLYVKNEMEVDGKKYFQLKGTWFGLTFSRLLRNEGEKIVTPQGKVFFSTTDLPDTIGGERDIPDVLIDSSYTLLLNHESIIETPLGSFESFFQFENRFFMNPVIINHEFLTRKDTAFYVKSLGVVKYTSFYTGSFNTEMRLLRTNVEM